ncbi:hypothetical protein OUZ56_013948 [Daphnia magna]|uniref:Uncharacterized protein n=1 Tax=Daphnia magna TaxID=35525 RepID=A0ABQ9Z7F7_9CRUS|nr:hypothetical protein OUZ56_013948 [Daphnia magna]
MDVTFFGGDEGKEKIELCNQQKSLEENIALTMDNNNDARLWIAARSHSSRFDTSNQEGLYSKNS